MLVIPGEAALTGTRVCKTLLCPLMYKKRQGDLLCSEVITVCAIGIVQHRILVLE